VLHARWLGAAAFVAAFVTRSAWWWRAPFHPDESTVLWMALDAVRHPHVPDHGLVSSYHVFQPPGLVWLTTPFVALGGGRPEYVIVAFGLLNAAAIGLLVATVAKEWGYPYAVSLGCFLAVGPDAFLSAWVWHPSLYTAAMALLLTAGIRLRGGSIWWALPLGALPVLYALIHYSGLVLFGPAIVLLLLSRRAWSELLVPWLIGTLSAVCAWVPFLSFESDRGWVDVRTVFDATGASSSAADKLHERLTDGAFAVRHLGESLYGPVHLTGVIWALVVTAVAIAVLHERWRDPGFATPAAMLASGVAVQVASAQGGRLDVLLVWLVPLYALAAWAVGQAVEAARAGTRRRTLGVAAGVAVVSVVLVGSADLAHSIRVLPYEQRLTDAWRAARSGAPVEYDPVGHPRPSENRNYLACDPPYGWGAQIWYLRDVLSPGSGRRAAERAGAFRVRKEPACGTGSSSR
jgi:4-amino-4-deoxy-L-arabinose transferase-like glycosyltransferase